MAAKDAEKNVKGWFWKLPDGTKQGPSDIHLVREKVLAGEITALTEVSQDSKNWSQAVSSSDFGFDCIVLQAGENLNVLGPFAREHMDRQDQESEIPSDGILYLRGGMVSEALPGSGVVGETGAALVEKVMVAEKRLRESLKEKRATEASLAAKDLEFDAERQRLNSAISSLKAEVMKIESELEGLRAEMVLSDADKGRRAKLEAKLVDTENAHVQASEEAKQLKSATDAAERKAKKLSSMLAEAEAGVQAAQKKQEELESRLADTGRQLSTRQARCVDLEGELAQKIESAAEWEVRVSELEARVTELDDKLQAAESKVAVAHDSSTWLYGRLMDLAKQAEAQFAEPLSSVTESTGNRGGSESVEAIEAEIVDDSSPAYAINLRTAKARSGEPRNVKLSAIEDQLKHEISALGASKAGSATSGHEGFINVFKRRK